MEETPIRDGVKDILAQLKQMQDRVALKIKLGNMEVSNLWKSLSQEMDQIRYRLEILTAEKINQSQEAHIQFHLGLMEAKDRWDQLKPLIHNLNRSLKNASSFVGAKVEIANLEANLARMDFNVFCQERLPEIKRKIEEAKESLVSHTRNLISDLKESFKEVGKFLEDK